MATRYLQCETNGRVFVWTPKLHARRDMRIITEAEAKKATAELEAEAKERARLVAEGEAGSGDQGQSPVYGGQLTVDAILGMTEKSELEAAGRSAGIELDKRKGVKTLQSELIEALGLS